MYKLYFAKKNEYSYFALIALMKCKPLKYHSTRKKCRLIQFQQESSCFQLFVSTEFIFIKFDVKLNIRIFIENKKRINYLHQICRWCSLEG